MKEKKTNQQLRKIVIVPVNEQIQTLKGQLLRSIDLLFQSSVLSILEKMQAQEEVLQDKIFFSFRSDNDVSKQVDMSVQRALQSMKMRTIYPKTLKGHLSDKELFLEELFKQEITDAALQEMLDLVKDRFDVLFIVINQEKVSKLIAAFGQLYGCSFFLRLGPKQMFVLEVDETGDFCNSNYLLP